MKKYGKLINGALLTPTAIHTENGWITNPSPDQFIEHGYKQVNRSEFPNYSFTETYEETETEITVIYTEVQPPAEVWEYQTNFKIKMNSDRFVAMVSEVNAIVTDVSRNVSMFGVTDIYLDAIDDEFRTLVNYYGGEIYDSREN